MACEGLKIAIAVLVLVLAILVGYIVMLKEKVRGADVSAGRFALAKEQPILDASLSSIGMRLRAMRHKSRAQISKLAAALQELASGNKAVVFVFKDDCPGCNELKQVLFAKGNGVNEDAIAVVKAEDLNQEEIQFVSTVPAIYYRANGKAKRFRHKGGAAMTADALREFVDATHNPGDKATAVSMALAKIDTHEHENDNGSHAEVDTSQPQEQQPPQQQQQQPPQQQQQQQQQQAPTTQNVYTTEKPAEALNKFQELRANGEGAVLLGICAMDCGWSRRFLEMMAQYDGNDIKLVALVIPDRAMPESDSGTVPLLNLYKSASHNQQEDINAYPSWIVATPDGTVRSGSGAMDVKKIVNPQLQI